MSIQVNAITNTTYQNNQNIRSVDLNYKPWVNNSMANAFYNCRNLVEVTNINNSITNINNAFYNCTNLTNAPVLPSSVVDLSCTFHLCNNLINAPAIPNSVTKMWSTFAHTKLENAPAIPNSVTNMGVTFWDCKNLKNPPEIPNSVIILYNTFEDCYNLANAPVVPNSVINASGFIAGCTRLFDPNKYPEIPQSVQKLDYMYAGMNKIATDVPQWCLDKWNNCSANVKTSMCGMFKGWANLVNAPTIPNSVTNMAQTFAQCYNLVNVSELPNSIIDMDWTFWSCRNLVTAPNIPESVTSIGSGITGAFSGCTNLTGNIFIHSKNIVPRYSSTCANIFEGTYKVKNVYIPYTYENGEYTKTYNSFTNGGYDENGTQHGVYLKDINSLITYTLTVTPSPIDATVTLEASGYATVTGTGAQSISVRPNTTVTYTVSKSGYDTKTDDVAVTQDPQSLAVSLYSYTPGEVLFESSTPGTYSFTPQVPCVVQIDAVGGGGGAMVTSLDTMAFGIAGGGSGNYNSGEYNLSTIEYQIVIGDKGTGVTAAGSRGQSATGGTGGTTSFSSLISATGGTGGYGTGSNAQGGVGYNNGQQYKWNGSWNTGSSSVSGGAGWNGYGDGGSAGRDSISPWANDGEPGYIKVTFLRYI